MGPTSYGDSPYQSFSAFAGNPYFIDLDLLVEEGLLDKETIEREDWGDTPSASITVNSTALDFEFCGRPLQMEARS